MLDVGVDSVPPWATLAGAALVALAAGTLRVFVGRCAVVVVARAPAVVLEGHVLVALAGVHAGGGAVAVTLGAVLEVAGAVVLVAATEVGRCLGCAVPGVGVDSVPPWATLAGAALVALAAGTLAVGAGWGAVVVVA